MRQLLYWRRAGVVTPSGSAQDADYYTLQDCLTLCVAGELRRRGVPLRHCLRIQRVLQGHGLPPPAARLWLVMADDGRTELASMARQIMRLLKSPHRVTGAELVELGPIVRAVKERAKEKSSPVTA